MHSESKQQGGGSSFAELQVESQCTSPNSASSPSSTAAPNSALIFFAFVGRKPSPSSVQAPIYLVPGTGQPPKHENVSVRSAARPATPKFCISLKDVALPNLQLPSWKERKTEKSDDEGSTRQTRCLAYPFEVTIPFQFNDGSDDDTSRTGCFRRLTGRKGAKAQPSVPGEQQGLLGSTGDEVWQAISTCSFFFQVQQVAKNARNVVCEIVDSDTCDCSLTTDNRSPTLTGRSPSQPAPQGSQQELTTRQAHVFSIWYELLSR